MGRYLTGKLRCNGVLGIIVTKDEKRSPILKLNSNFFLQILTLLGLFLFVSVDMPCHSIKLSHIWDFPVTE